MIKVQSTTDYSKFKLMKGNRPVRNRVTKLIREIKERKNMLAQFPILCQKNNDGRLYVADGQHRLEAAKALKLPVFYTVSDHITIEDVAHANSLQKAWNIKDYLASWIARGNKHYAFLKDFCERYSIPLTVAFELLGSGGSGGNALARFRKGAFVTQGVAFAERVGAMLLAIKPVVPFYAERSFVIALSRVMRLKQFDAHRFLQKLEYQSTKMVQCANWEQYVSLIEEVYNFKVRSSDLVPLAMEIKRAR